jgi:pyruvate carboxylase subunit B
VAPVSLGKGEIAIQAPMPGMIIDYKVNEGEKVKSGDVVLILEAMKMENSLTAPASGTIKKINCKAGSSVSKDETLCVIATDG